MPASNGDSTYGISPGPVDKRAASLPRPVARQRRAPPPGPADAAVLSQRMDDRPGAVAPRVAGRDLRPDTPGRAGRAGTAGARGVPADLGQVERQGPAGPGDGRAARRPGHPGAAGVHGDRKSTRLNSCHRTISYAVFCLKKKKNQYLVRCFLRKLMMIDEWSIVLH